MTIEAASDMCRHISSKRCFAPDPGSADGKHNQRGVSEALPVSESRGVC